MTNDEVEYSDEGDGTSYSSSSETKSRLNETNPFGSLDDNNKNVKTNIMFPDIVEPDIPGAQPSSTTSSESQSQYQSGTVYGNTNVNINKKTTNDNSNDILSLEKTTSTESSLTSSSQSAQAESSNEVYGDFNGDGFDDLTVGVPGEDVGSISDAGGVEVIYGSSSGLSATLAHADQFWTQDSTNIDDSAETSDGFGNSLAIGDFNGDGFDDLAIGVSGEDVGSIGIAGGVEVIYGSSSGLSATLAHADQFWTQDSTNIDDSAEKSDLFGLSLSSGDFNADGKDDLAIGVPVEVVGSISIAGGVEVIYGSSSGLSATLAHADQFWTQDSTNIDNSAETGDNFGISLTAADFNADGKDDLAIGVANEDLGSVINVGGVEVIYGSSSGLSATLAHADQFWTQENVDIDDSAEASDQFGYSLATGDFNADGKDDLAIGVPFEDVGSISGAGGVEVIYGSSNGLSATLAHADQFWSQDSPDIDGGAETGDFFSHSLG